MTDRPAGDESPIVPFLRIGPRPDRTRWEGWQQWRRIRGTFIPAPRLSLQEYLDLSPRRRGLHDLHRTATHVNMRLQETPMSVRVSGLMRGRLQNNAVKFMPGTRDGLMVNGGGFQGKTETACSAAAAFEDLWRAVCRQVLPDQQPQIRGTRDVFVPVAYCRLPVRATPKALCKTILDVYRDPHPKNLDDLIRSVRDAVRDHNTTALLIDDVTRLRLHRGDDQDTLDLMASPPPEGGRVVPAEPAWTSPMPPGHLAPARACSRPSDSSLTSSNPATPPRKPPPTSLTSVWSPPCSAPPGPPAGT